MNGSRTGKACQDAELALAACELEAADVCKPDCEAEQKAWLAGCQDM